MKSIKLIVGGLLLVLIIAGVVVYFNLSRIVRVTIEDQGSKSLNLKTTLEDADLAIFGGSLDLDKLRIGSPKDYPAAHMLELEKAGVKVSYGQLRKNPVRINEITLKKPKVVIEQINGRFNFQALMDLPSSGGDMKLIIDKLTIEEASVVLRPGIPGLQEEFVIKVPTITLANIGNADGSQNGAAMKQVALLVITSLAEKSAETGGSGQIKSALQGSLQGVQQRIQGEIGGKVKDLDKTLNGFGVEGVGDKVQGELDKALGGLGGEKAPKEEQPKKTQPKKKERGEK